MFNNGEKRYEIRHLNDLRLAHPDSLTAPASRPKLGRPKTTVQVDDQPATDANHTGFRQTRTNVPFPEPPAVPTEENKQTYSTGRVPTDVGNTDKATHETSISKDRQPDSERNNAPGRPVRTTRNPNPAYIDAIQWSPKPWQASKTELELLNKSISGASFS